MVLDQVIEEQFKATKNQELATCIHGRSGMKAVFEGPGRGWPMGQHWSESKPPERVVKVNSRWIKDLTENPTLKEAQENIWKLTGKPLRTIEHKARKKRTNASDYIKMKSLLQITHNKTKTEMICLALRNGSSWEGAAWEKRWPWNSVFSFWQNSTPCRKSLFLSVH